MAESYARIFYRNAIDGGFITPFEGDVDLNKNFSTGDEIEIDMNNNLLINKSNGETYQLKPLGEVLPIVESGGLFQFARKTNMI